MLVKGAPVRKPANDDTTSYYSRIYDQFQLYCTCNMFGRISQEEVQRLTKYMDSTTNESYTSKR